MAPTPRTAQHLGAHGARRLLEVRRLVPPCRGHTGELCPCRQQLVPHAPPGHRYRLAGEQGAPRRRTPTAARARRHAARITALTEAAWEPAQPGRSHSRHCRARPVSRRSDSTLEAAATRATPAIAAASSRGRMLYSVPFRREDLSPSAVTPSRAGVVKLADARDSKSRGITSRGGSSPPSGTSLRRAVAWRRRASARQAARYEITLPWQGRRRLSRRSPGEGGLHSVRGRRLVR